VSEDEAEEVARQATAESGLDDRPRCDPRTLAVSYLGLRLAPLPGMRPRLDGGIVWYPSDAPDDAIPARDAASCWLMPSSVRRARMRRETPDQSAVDMAGGSHGGSAHGYTHGRACTVVLALLVKRA